MAGLAAILVPSALPAQVTFQRTYDGRDNDFGYSVQQTTDGGYIIAGQTGVFGPSPADAYLVRTDADGDTLWTRTYGSGNEDGASSVLQTKDGGYIIAGFTESSGAGFSDVYLIKVDANGDSMWTRTFGGTGSDDGMSIQQTLAGGYIIAGFTYSFGSGNRDVYLVRTDADGETLWTKTYGGADRDVGCSVARTEAGGYVIAGYTDSFGAGQDDIYVVKTNAHGDTLWTRTFGGQYDDEGYLIQPTTDGGYIIAGETWSYGVGDVNIYLIKIDGDGDTLWSRALGDRQVNEGFSVQQTTDGGYVVAGMTDSVYPPNMNLCLIKTDANGNALWTRTYGGTREELGYSVEQTADGGYIITGYTDSFGADGADVYLVKTDSLGNVAVAEPKASPTRAPALSLSCEPNPFSGATTIRLSPFASRPSPLVLRIYDAQGRLTKTITVNRTPYTVWDGTDELGHALPSGAYFAVLAAAGQHATTRLVLQR
jgi:hypothetical protein